jgi:hypothetical protein
MKYVLSICLLLLAAAPCSAFMSTARASWTARTNAQSMLPEASMWIATIDADIANIADNEFAPIFLGGIGVMFGGLLSASAVGFMLEKGDLYANIVADSYIQQGNDEEFWKGLSEEERIKGQEILRQLEAKKNGEMPADAPIVVPTFGAEATSSKAPEGPVAAAAPAKEKDMFSDY